MTKQVDTHWFHGVLADKRMSQRRLAALMGLDPAAVSLMLRGKRKMSANEVAEMARLLGVSVQEILVRAGAEGHGADLKRSEAVLAARVKVNEAESVSATGKAVVGGSGGAEFMKKWMDLGFMLMRANRG